MPKKTGPWVEWVRNEHIYLGLGLWKVTRGVSVDEMMEGGVTPFELKQAVAAGDLKISTERIMLKRQPCSDIKKLKISTKLRGRKKSPLTRARMSAARRKYLRSLVEDEGK